MTNSEHQELIAFLGRQFTTIDRRFERIDRRFEAIDQRFDAMDRRFDAIDEKFQEVLGHFDEVYRRLERLEQGNIMRSSSPSSESRPLCWMRRTGASSWNGAYRNSRRTWLRFRLA